MAIDNGIAGSPQTVRDFIAAEIDGDRRQLFRAWLAFGDMTLAESLRSLELFSREVMPAFASCPPTRTMSCVWLYRGLARLQSIGTMAASLELRSVSEVLTLRTCGAAVSSATKA